MISGVVHMEEYKKELNTMMEELEEIDCIILKQLCTILRMYLSRKRRR